MENTLLRSYYYFIVLAIEASTRILHAHSIISQNCAGNNSSLQTKAARRRENALRRSY